MEIVILRSMQGTVQVLIHHAPLPTQLEGGEIRLTNLHGKEQIFASSGGCAEVRLNEVTVLSETIELATEIDTERARSAKGRGAYL